jgi:protein-disulfide isomerase
MLAAVRADGRVRLVYRDWPIFGAVSERAARLALASDYQGIYPDVHDALMHAGSLDDATVRLAVEQAGGDWARLLVDLAAHRGAIDAHLARNAAHAQALGLEGTPGYLAGPILIRGAMDETAFRRAFAQARAEGKP